ncbi:hypothetical protein HK099_000556 [Clydaea vesicula]|uniref:DNA helicase n=1 Tax=Clydaea vesicula TaxID=447962 RepID=A0AAD5XXI6_9FUNG|nr:hypothetical protein HK099_000556 [Clydaea vesicula]
MDIKEWVEKQRSLINLERETEMEEVKLLNSNFPPSELARKGVAILGLYVAGIRMGLGGKYLVELTAGPGVENIKPHKLKVGDIVSISEVTKKDKVSTVSNDDSGFKISGLIYQIREGKIVLSFKDAVPDELQEKISIFKISNQVTYERIFDTLNKILLKNEDSLTRCLFNFRKPNFCKKNIESLKFFNHRLNPSQKIAIEFALNAEDVALIHGPPGTGKTQCCLEIIQQLCKRGERVLVCGPSNISVDNLECRVKTCDEGKIANDVRNDVEKALKGVSKCKNRKDRRLLYDEIKIFRKELKERERKVVDNLLKGSQVILSTLSGASNKKLLELVKDVGPFDTVLIDEASQALEVECWIPILNSKKLILAGDHLQLPPTIKSRKNEVNNSNYNIEESLEFTLFDRLLKIHGTGIKRMLDTQYRSNEKIMKFSSKTLYDDKLKADISVKNRILTDSQTVTPNDDTTIPLLYIDTMGEMRESEENTSTNNFSIAGSKLNTGEAELVVKHIKSLVDAGVALGDIAVISPYSAQVNLLTLTLRPLYNDSKELEIGTVDGFQGREKSCIILSLVRSNENGEVGFLSDERRLNVAITRAKAHLCIIGDSETLTRSGGYLKRFVEFLEEEGEVRYC